MITKTGGCIPAACELKFENNSQGSVYYVMKVRTQDVDHAYYVPDETKLDDIALNCTDNGYSQYPPLTVREVIENGTKYLWTQENINTYFLSQTTMKKVIIASKNPVKIESVKQGFMRMFPNDSFEFEGSSISSGVSDQPIGNTETRTGAINRAEDAKTEFQDADYWVGLEGGIIKTETEMEAFAWIVVKSKDLIGKSKTSTFFLPQKMVELVDSGIEMGEADDIVFGLSNSKQKQGTVGTLTGNVIDRTKYYREAVVLALIPFKNSEHYWKKIKILFDIT